MLKGACSRTNKEPAVVVKTTAGPLLVTANCLKLDTMEVTGPRS